MKPIIGVTISMEIDQSYYMTRSHNVNAILKAGGIPVLLPYFHNAKDIQFIAEKIDGLYVTGGYDIDPSFFGEEPHPKLGSVIPERDDFEIKLINEMLSMDKPILGVCRGCQTLNIAIGGDMYQDIYEQMDKPLIQHMQKAPRDHGSHFVEIDGNTLLHRITKALKIKVNSFHHQANRRVVDPFLISGVANDGVIEAIESKKHKFALGVQWHPESMVDEVSMRIYQSFIQACRDNE